MGHIPPPPVAAVGGELALDDLNAIYQLVDLRRSGVALLLVDPIVDVPRYSPDGTISYGYYGCEDLMTLSAKARTHSEDCGRNDVYAAACPCREMLDLLANKWSALAIGTLEDGPRRFGELKRMLEGISPKVLSATLKRLEDAGLLTRTVFAEVPLRVEYALTPLGVGAAEPLAHLRSWVDQNVIRH